MMPRKQPEPNHLRDVLLGLIVTVIGGILVVWFQWEFLPQTRQAVSPSHSNEPTRDSDELETQTSAALERALRLEKEAREAAERRALAEQAVRERAERFAREERQARERVTRAAEASNKAQVDPPAQNPPPTLSEESSTEIESSDQSPQPILDVPGFTYLRSERFTCVATTHRLHVYRNDLFWEVLGKPEDSAIDTEFVLLPGGSFGMGSPQEERGREDVEAFHIVHIARPFLIGRTEVSSRVWRALEKRAGFERWVGTGGGKRAIVNLSWKEANQWATGVGLRLPSEAEWEYACRGGTTTSFSFGDDEGRLGHFASRCVGCNHLADPVGAKLPNAFGLYDMHGGALEWVQDYFGPYSEVPSDGSPRTRPTEYRVSRGGSWQSQSGECRSASRTWHEFPFGRGYTTGVRVARTAR